LAPGASARIGSMLLGRDVSEELEPAHRTVQRDGTTPGAA